MNKKHILLRRVFRASESGFTITIQALYYTVLLFMFFALIYDFGNVGYVQSIGNNAVRVAAQDAAKNIDPQVFVDTQEIRLNGDALTDAQNVVNGLTGNKVKINSISVARGQTRDVIMVNATATARLPIIGSLFGINSINLPLVAYAEPAYGIQTEGQ